jgi:hypothetical protein
MDRLFNAAIDHIWPKIPELQELTTPDAAVWQGFSHS